MYEYAGFQARKKNRERKKEKKKSDQTSWET